MRLRVILTQVIGHIGICRDLKALKTDLKALSGLRTDRRDKNDLIKHKKQDEGRLS